MDDPILIDIPQELVGERVLVRPYRFGDGKALHDAVAESRDRLRLWMPFADQHQSVSESELFARRCAAGWITRSESIPLSVWSKEAERFLGGLGLTRIDWQVRKFEIGYWLRDSAEGHGYMTEAVRLACSMAFTVLRASRLFIRCGTENHRSCAIPKRLGFLFEGVLHNDGRLANGDLFDLEIYSMTPDRWQD